MNYSMRSTAIAAVALLAITAGCLGAVDESFGGDDPEDLSGEEIADRVTERHDEIEDIHGVQRIDAAGTSTTSEVWIKPPDKYRSEPVDSDAETSMTTISNGTTTWIYDSESNTVTTTRHDASGGGAFNLTNSERVRKLLDEFEVESAGTDTVAGRDAYVLELAATNETVDDVEYEEYRLWIDAEYWYPIKHSTTISTDGSGDTALADETFESTVEFESIEFNTGVGDERFEFTPPEDATVTDRQITTFASASAAAEAAPMDVSLPDDLPVDHELEHATLEEHEGNATVSLSYRKGEEEYFSVMITQSEPVSQRGESTELDGVEATLDTLGDRTSLQWSCDGLAYTVFGPFGEETIREIGERIGCE